MRRPESHFRSNQRIRSGIFYFLCLMLLLEGVRRSVSRPGAAAQFRTIADTTFTWQPDTARTGVFNARASNRGRPTPRPTDVNRLDDFRGYRLGIPARALDSLYAYLRTGNRVRSPEVFQAVTGLPDSAIGRLRPLLSFPLSDKGGPLANTGRPAASRVRDLNRATAASLQAVRGVGPVLSARIVKFRDALGGFQHAGQLYDVYGLSAEVADRVAAQFQVIRRPEVRRLDINTATVEELASLVYLDWQMARDIAARRRQSGPFNSLEELGEITSIPKDRIERIALYLSLEKQ